MSIGWSKGHVIMKSVVIVIPLVEFDIGSLELDYFILSHNKWDLLLKLWEVILIGDNTTF